MLTLMRNNLQSPFMKLLVFVVVIVMGFWGVTTYSSQSLNIVATVGGEEIPVSAYQEAWQAFSMQIRQNDQIKDFEQYAESFNLRHKILDRLVNESLLLQLAKSNGLNVTKEEIASFIYNSPSFQTDGRFDMDKYNTIIDQSNQSKNDYENKLQKELLRSKFFTLVGGLRFVSESATKTNYILKNTNYRVKYFAINKEAFAKNVKATDKEIKDYYNKHKANYKTEQTYDLDYAVLTADSLVSKDQISQKAIDRFYNHNKQLFPANVKTKIDFITVPYKDHATISKVYAELKKNPKSIKHIAKQYKAAKVKYTTMPWKTKKQLESTFLKQDFTKVKVNNVLRPFVKDGHSYLVRVVDRKVDKESQAAINEQITNKILVAKRTRKLQSQKDKYASITDADKMNEIVTSHKLKWQTLTKFKYGAPASGNLDQVALWQALTKRKKEKVGVAQSVKQLVFYKIKKINPAKQKTFDQVKDQVKQQVLSDKQQQYLSKQLKQWGQDITSQARFNSVVSKYKLQSKEAQYTHDNAKISGMFIPSNIAGKLRVAKEKQAIAFQSFGNGYVIYISQVMKPNENNADFKDKLAGFQKQEEQETAIQFLEDLIAIQKKKLTITYNQDVLKALKI